MKSSLKELILFLILTAMFSESYSDFFFMNPVSYSVECSQSDRGQTNKADSPFCLDNDTKDFLNWHPQLASQYKSISQDHLFSNDFFELSTYSIFVWQPPEST